MCFKLAYCVRSGIGNRKILFLKFEICLIKNLIVSGFRVLSIKVNHVWSAYLQCYLSMRKEMYNPIKNFEVCVPKVRQTIKIKNESHKYYK